ERAAGRIDALEMGMAGGNLLSELESIQTTNHGQAMIYGLRCGWGLLVQLMPDVVQQRGLGDLGKGLGLALKPPGRSEASHRRRPVASAATVDEYAGHQDSR